MSQSKLSYPTTRNHEHPTQEMHTKKIFIISVIFLVDKHDEIVWGRKVKKDLVMKENSILG